MNQVVWAPVAMSSFQRHIREILSSIPRETMFGLRMPLRKSWINRGVSKTGVKAKKNAHNMLCAVGRMETERRRNLLHFVFPASTCPLSLWPLLNPNGWKLKHFFSIQTNNYVVCRFCVHLSLFHTSTLSLFILNGLKVETLFFPFHCLTLHTFIPVRFCFSLFPLSFLLFSISFPFCR